MIAINRVAKVVKGGRRFSFNALVAVGDGQGKVGFATGKANEVSEAVRKAVDAARRNMVNDSAHGRHDSARDRRPARRGRVLMKPAAPGAGVIAGGAVRAIMECAGITDILTKSLGSTNPHNMVLAALDGLQQLTTVEQIARERGIEVVERSGYRSRAQGRRRRCNMPRTFVWHPDKGPKHDAEAEPADDGARCGSSRCGAGSAIRGGCAARSRRSASGITRTSRQAGFTPSLRGQLKQVRHLVRGDAGRRSETQRRWKRARRASRRSGCTTSRRRRARTANREAPRPRPGLGHGQDVGQGTQGHQGARGPSRPGRRQAAVRRRPDAAHAPLAEARLHEPVPRGIQVVRLDDLARRSSGEKSRASRSSRRG